MYFVHSEMVMGIGQYNSHILGMGMGILIFWECTSSSYGLGMGYLKIISYKTAVSTHLFAKY